MREVWDDAQRTAAVEQITGALSGGVTGDVLDRTLEYWRSVDGGLGARIENAVRQWNTPETAECMGKA